MQKKGFKHSEESKRKMSETRKNKRIIPWNKGLTKETDERVKLASELYLNDINRMEKLILNRHDIDITTFGIPIANIVNR